ncbi:hypothetical protein H4R19_000428 [Coemansia spiralis]|nr:hypothetical protein H4R19_000428 [Coemansia spiralis]
MSDGPDQDQRWPLDSTGYLQAFTLALYIISAFISLAAFVYGVTLSYLQRQVWRNAIIRVMVIAQFFNCLRFIFLLLVTNATLTTESACRVALFMADAMSLLPVNLCVYCVVYLQLVMIHNVSPELRWPRVVALTTATLLSVVPPSPTLYISPRVIGRASFCDMGAIPTSKEYAYSRYTYVAWAYLPGVIGTFSVLTIAVHLVRTRRALRNAMQASTEQYGPSLSVARVGHTETLHQALITIIWFPITPIIALWFNAILYTVAYYKWKTYRTLECINVILLCLQSLLLGLPLIVNPTMRAALAKQVQEQREPRRAVRSTTHGLLPLSPQDTASDP